MKAKEIPEFKPTRHGNMFEWVLQLVQEERRRQSGSEPKLEVRPLLRKL